MHGPCSLRTTSRSSSSRSIPGHTPYELVHNAPPNLSCAHEFGTPVLVHLEHAGKLEPKAEDALFVGVDGESKAYRVYWPAKRRVSVERNVTFVPPTVIVADSAQAEGEPNQPAPQRPSTPPMPTHAPVTPPAPRATRIRPPPGYYAALNEGELAALAGWEETAMAAAVAEPTLAQALRGPDAQEWQEALDSRRKPNTMSLRLGDKTRPGWPEAQAPRPPRG